MTLLGVLDSNKQLDAKEVEQNMDEIIVAMVLSLEQPTGNEDQIAPEAVYKVIEARTAVTDDAIEEERVGFFNDILEKGTGHDAFRKAMKQAYLMDGTFGKTKEAVEEYMIQTFMPELDFNKVSIAKNLLERIAIAVVSREVTVAKALQEYMRRHKESA